MKTITLKADDAFDALLTGLARNLNTTKSGVHARRGNKL